MLKIANEFIQFFGVMAIKSLLILYVQMESSTTGKLVNLKDKIENSEGFKKLKNENKNQKIPTCLWDLSSSNFNCSDFCNCLNTLETFSSNMFLNSAQSKIKHEANNPNLQERDNKNKQANPIVGNHECQFQSQKLNLSNEKNNFDRNIKKMGSRIRSHSVESNDVTKRLKNQTENFTETTTLINGTKMLHNNYQFPKNALSKKF